jgi:hypothetical protein
LLGEHRAEEASGSGPWALGSELIANVVRVDYPAHVAAATNRQLRPHVLALLASSRWRLGGPIVRCLLRESLNPGHRHGSPNAWAAIRSPCLADYILEGHFGQEAVRRSGEQLGRTSTSRTESYSTGDLGSRLTPPRSAVKGRCARSTSGISSPIAAMCKRSRAATRSKASGSGPPTPIGSTWSAASRRTR